MWHDVSRLIWSSAHAAMHCRYNTRKRQIFSPHPYLYRLSLNILKLKYILNLKYCVKFATCADCNKLFVKKNIFYVLVKVGSIVVIKIIDLLISH